MSRGYFVWSFVLVLALFSGIVVVQAEEATLTWQVRSYDPDVVHLKFYSDDRNSEWPKDGRVYVLGDYEIHKYRLECEYAEKICFGAWVKGNSNQYWGVGRDAKNHCPNCCHKCLNNKTGILNLKPFGNK